MLCSYVVVICRYNGKNHMELGDTWVTNKYGNIQPPPPPCPEWRIKGKYFVLPLRYHPPLCMQILKVDLFPPWGRAQCAAGVSLQDKVCTRQCILITKSPFISFQDLPHDTPLLWWIVYTLNTVTHSLLQTISDHMTAWSCKSQLTQAKLFFIIYNIALQCNLRRHSGTTSYL